MNWFLGGGVLYLVLLVVFGVLTIRKGHVMLFVFGLFLPFLWLIGAMMPPRAAARR